ncbi:MAG: hypothetical protein JST54_27830 [Deltaproteobacteria bacterium]|nr:hypothetical protein [Deltaproteobacteria bacterium]
MDEPKARQTTQSEDAFGLAQNANADELTRLKLAEELFELRYQRQRRRSRIQMASQSLVGLVAVGGFFANAFQSYVNKQQQQHQQQVDQDRWNREFERAKAADKYRAFFETSALVTDEANANKRLVGYALLQEFVGDDDYNSKATLLLEEALVQELRRKTTTGLDEERRAAVTAILGALSATSSCKALVHASKSIDRIASRKAQTGDAAEASEVFGVYVRSLLGRAVLNCASLADVQEVRRPLVATLQRAPELAGLKVPPAPTAAQARTRVAELLRQSCLDDIAAKGNSDCAEVFTRYTQLCAKVDPKKPGDEAEGCQVMSQPLPPMPVRPTPVPDAGADDGN